MENRDSVIHFHSWRLTSLKLLHSYTSLFFSGQKFYNLILRKKFDGNLKMTFQLCFTLWKIKRRNNGLIYVQNYTTLTVIDFIMRWKHVPLRGTVVHVALERDNVDRMGDKMLIRARVVSFLLCSTLSKRSTTLSHCSAIFTFRQNYMYQDRSQKKLRDINYIGHIPIEIVISMGALFLSYFYWQADFLKVNKI